MSFMQTGGVILLIPLLLPFFIGSLLLAIRLNKQGVVTRVLVVVFISALIIGPAGSILSKTIFGYAGDVLSLSVLGLIAAGQVTIGIELILDLLNKKIDPMHFAQSSLDEQTLHK